MDFNARKTILTQDGSPTLALDGHHETYHSRHGAVQESRHVFIAEGLDALESQPEVIRVFELGFGTGLNALLAWEWAEAQGKKVIYECIEAYPLKPEEWQTLQFDIRVSNLPSPFSLLHEAKWEEPVVLSERFTLIKKVQTWASYQGSAGFDVFFFDAFGPPTQPEMWTSFSLKKSVDLLNEGACWVSYCSKGQVRRDLEAAGLTMEKRPGPPGKREMLRGWRAVAHPQVDRWNLRCYMLLVNEEASAVLVSDERRGGVEMIKFPGGGMEFGEGPVGCIEREAIEELGQPVQVLDHFYTTEWFQRSRFRESDQLISMYYLVQTQEPPKFKTSPSRLDIPEDREETFRWLNWKSLAEEPLSFPIDRWVRELLLRKYAPELANPTYAPEYV